MMNKMGIKVNVDEANVLLVSADQDKNNVLSMNEFFDLIFNANDAMNVDLSKLHALDPSQVDKETGQGIMEGLRQKAEENKE